MESRAVLTGCVDPGEPAGQSAPVPAQPEIDSLTVTFCLPAGDHGSVSALRAVRSACRAFAAGWAAAISLSLRVCGTAVWPASRRT